MTVAQSIWRQLFPQPVSKTTVEAELRVKILRQWLDYLDRELAASKAVISEQG